MRFVFYSLLLLLGCQQKQSKETSLEIDTTSVETTPDDAYEDANQNYNYREFFGTYDHESNAKGFTAMLVLTPNGNDVYFNASVSQGTCKGNLEGVVMMAEHTDMDYLGFYESEECRLQFTLNRVEKTVDIKEIGLCHLLEQGCSFEGVYAKRKD